ncbi:MAG TPA: imidazolonepropionase [Candidatus Alistipes avicola]|uniref:Imidazolonepropionase n=1 Tax=Candidatus Alistipes avicola TaxID=2838432 RepID=A0A9D2IC69_9BACT|nr:imidazolonepropionase [uncultured Alistipes sp.]HJA98570.1 imidazolonepropionase [Candidatus Alistipes avicola]
MLLVKNIAKIVGVDESGRLRVEGSAMNTLGEIDNAWLLVENDRIAAYGTMDKMPEVAPGTEIVDAEGGMLFPSFCDSHTHLVYAGSREQEFIDKINGLSYEEIAKRGGGILNSADRLHETSEDELYEQAMERIREIISMGTGCVEIKSGYGLTVEDELKMLRVIRRIKETSPITVKATFLGAHAVGRAYKGRQGEYVDLIIREMIPAVAKENLAEFIDVFCDEGFFTVEETERMMQAAAKYGIVPKIHANEMAVSGGVQVGVRNNALSVDHLERMGAEEIKVLAGSRTMPTMLPGAAFFLELPFPPARQMIEAGLGVALASDFNPGSSPSGNMKFVLSLACIKMRMTPAEAINAATLNSAYAMGLSKEYGSITVGKKANFFLTSRIPSIEYIPYAYTSPLVRRVFLQGREVKC